MEEQCYHSNAMALCYPMAVGLNKGHKVSNSGSKPRYSCCCHGHLTKHTKFVQGMIPEVCCFISYISKDKCPLKFIKKSVGTYNRAKRKRGKEQSPGSHEESSSQEGLNPLPSVYNTASLELEKEIKNF
ncbi:unnamed protein product [Nyctereutes procyonoides]|uniref:Large ribosomal subunit protein eL36 n=1 Tax=Nyctereutes procyonoides TaxID=34880 RepID=A0A811YDA7_NYCPR|nr:unnamed protein product [Nyctereutes procyonoides]